MRRILPKLALAAVLLAAVAGLIVWRDPVMAWGRQTWARLIGAPEAQDNLTLLIASGSIEASSVDVAAAASGRITKLYVTDGQQVQAGQPVADLDKSVLEAQISNAAAAVKVAEALAQQVRAGPREADLAVARAAVDQARMAWGAANTAASDAAALVDAPAPIDVEIARAETNVQVADAQVDAANAGATAADLEQQLWGRIVQRLEGGVDVPLPPQLGGGTKHMDAPADKLAEARLQWNFKSQAAWEAHAQQSAAVAARNAARQALADLRAQEADPVTLQGQAGAAKAAEGVADAGVDLAEANLNVLRAVGTSSEQIAVADAAVERAKAAQASLEAKRPHYTVLAPRGGALSEVVLHEGEVAAEGVPIARIRDSGDVTLTVYVPEARMAKVQPGAPAAVSLDAFPGRTFAGTVTNVAGEAEFTPKNVQTREERAATVFAVKITLANEDSALKSGTLADAFFCPTAVPCAYPFEALAQQESSRPADLLGRVLPQAAQPGPTPVPTASAYAGSLEATRVNVAAEVGGRVVEVKAAEGDAVKAGQVLAVIDGAELAAQAAEADAGIAAARAEMARVEAKPQPQRVAQAEANVKQAEAALKAAEVRRDAAEAQLRNQQGLEAQINSARQAITTAAAAVDAARAQLKSARVLQESLANPGSDEDKTRRAAYDAGVQAASARVRAAEAQQAGARKVLAALTAIRNNPVALRAGLNKAVGEVEMAAAAVKVAQAAAAQVSAPPQEEAVTVARARVSQAEAGRAAIDAALAKLAVSSPITGEVTAQAIHTGEVATPGAPLFTVADLSKLRLSVYVPLPELAGVRVGMPAQVTIDAYPGRTFPGAVTRIAEQAEFTPKNVQTAEERARMVLRVEITVDNPDAALRPGMGATARW